MRKRLNYANVVSTLALFGVIAGGTAAALPGKKTVEANDLKKNSVKAKAVAKAAIRGSEIKDGAVAGAEVADLGLGYQDLGSNSVVTRIRSTGAVQTGDGGEANPVPIPVTGNEWTQAGNEIDVLFGEVTYTEPAACTNGFVDVQFILDGELVDEDSYSNSVPGPVTEPFARSRPFAFEPGADTARKLEFAAWDGCDNAGEQYTVEDIKVNVVAIR
jgi:hypothetical protein